MTGEELKTYFRTKLVAQRSIAQEFDVLDTLVDFISQSVTSGIPAWDDELEFNEDGTDDGAFCTYPGDTGTLRFWKSKINGNINNAPPTSSIIIEDDNWEEVSPATGSAIKEWAPGVFGEGLIIVFYDTTGTDPALYKLTEATRPYHSTNFTTEYTDGTWQRITPAAAGGVWYHPDLFDASDATGSEGDYPEAPLGSGPEGVILRGNSYDVGTASDPYGPDDDVKFPAGCTLRALIDNPGQDDENWKITLA